MVDLRVDVRVESSESARPRQLAEVIKTTQAGSTILSRCATTSFTF
jgi:hypothetical protein